MSSCSEVSSDTVSGVKSQFPDGKWMVVPPENCDWVEGVWMDFATKTLRAGLTSANRDLVMSFQRRGVGALLGSYCAILLDGLELLKMGSRSRQPRQSVWGLGDAVAVTSKFKTSANLYFGGVVVLSQSKEFMLILITQNGDAINSTLYPVDALERGCQQSREEAHLVKARAELILNHYTKRDVFSAKDLFGALADPPRPATGGKKRNSTSVVGGGAKRQKQTPAGRSKSTSRLNFDHMVCSAAATTM